MNAPDPAASLPREGYALVVKRDCPTCSLIEPVCHELSTHGLDVQVFSQDDPSFPDSVDSVIDDTSLYASWRFDIETVPTLVRLENGTESGRAVGWHREEWQSLTGVAPLGENLPGERPGCGSKSVDPGMVEELVVRFGDPELASRGVDVAYPADAIEACFDRGWSDGLPVTPPTPQRVLRMLEATARARDDVIGEIPPSMAPCTVEKAAINAVMAGCKPEYFPVVLAALDAALDPVFSLHGVLCTTDFVGPWIIVSGPVARRIGMNSGVNALGQGNRANSTIGRALQLIVRNVGGGRPGEIDRSTLGQPGKIGVSFAENADHPQWESLSERRGFAADTSTVTVFAGAGVQPVWDERSRTGESLADSFARSISVIGHAKRLHMHDAMIVISPDHHRIFAEAGWDVATIAQEINARTAVATRDILRGAGDNAEGLLEAQTSGDSMTKFSGSHQMILVRAGGPAGLMSAIISGWAASGDRGSSPVTREIST